MELLVETSRHTCIIARSHQMFLVCFSQVLIFQGQQPLMELKNGNLFLFRLETLLVVATSLISKAFHHHFEGWGSQKLRL